jgi:hypothetical protein
MVGEPIHLLGACTLRRASIDAPCLPCRLRADLPSPAGLWVTGASAAWPWTAGRPWFGGCRCRGSRREPIQRSTVTVSGSPCRPPSRRQLPPGRWHPHPGPRPARPGGPAPTSARSLGPRPSPTPRDGGLTSPGWASLDAGRSTNGHRHQRPGAATPGAGGDPPAVRRGRQAHRLSVRTRLPRREPRTATCRPGATHRAARCAASTARPAASAAALAVGGGGGAAAGGDRVGVCVAAGGVQRPASAVDGAAAGQHPAPAAAAVSGVKC